MAILHNLVCSSLFVKEEQVLDVRIPFVSFLHVLLILMFGNAFFAGKTVLLKIVDQGRSHTPFSSMSLRSEVMQKSGEL